MVLAVLPGYVLYVCCACLVQKVKGVRGGGYAGSVTV